MNYTRRNIAFKVERLEQLDTLARDWAKKQNPPVSPAKCRSKYINSLIEKAWKRR